MIMSCFL